MCILRNLEAKRNENNAKCVFRHYNFVKYILSKKSLFKNVLKNFDKQHLNEIIAVWYDFTVNKALYNPLGCNNKHVLFSCIFNNSRWWGRISNNNVNFLQTFVKFPLSSDRYRRSYSDQNWFPILQIDEKIRKCPSLNTQSCNKRPLCSTFTFENVRSPKKPV